MFSVSLLPAGAGDSIWIDYGCEEKCHRILIDGGVTKTGEVLRRRINALPVDQRRFELLVVTHIDRDHIGGIVDLLRDPPEGLYFEDIWFNGRKHLPAPDDLLGVTDGIALSVLVENAYFDWNFAFEGKAVAVSENRNPVRVLKGGMRLTLFSPTATELRRLQMRWDREIEIEMGREKRRRKSLLDDAVMGEVDIDALAAIESAQDQSVPNASSIVIMAEYDGKRCLFPGDVPATLMVKALQNYLVGTRETKLVIDALKVSHHGGKLNTSSELLDLIDCPTYLVSTDGTGHRHPDRETIARILRAKARHEAINLVFNHRTEFTAPWGDLNLERKLGYLAQFPSPGRSGIVVSL